MRPRIVVLSLLDPLGEHGLAPDVRAAIELGVDAIPIASSVLGDAPGNRLRRTPARQLEAALRRAFEKPVDGMLIGPVDGYWQSRAVARVLGAALPETLVFAPSLGTVGPHPSGRVWAIQRQAVLPIATVALMPQHLAGELLLADREADPHRAATAILDAGAHAAWLPGDDDSRRAIDVIANGTQTSVIDYSPTGRGLIPAGPLAALLALGLPLRESIDRAHRLARGLGDSAYIASAR